MHDFYDLLRGVECLTYLGANRPFSHTGGEVLYYRVVNVRLKERQTHLAHHCIHISSRKFAFSPQLGEYLVEPAGQIFKQSNTPWSSTRPMMEIQQGF